VKVAKDYYRELFKKELKSDIDIDSDFSSEGDKVTEENVVLKADFIEEEVKKAVYESYSMEHLVLMGLALCSIRNFGYY
jgi:hypothetical protein